MKKLCLAVTLLSASLAHAAYKCVDERGETLIGDVPPAGCASVMMYEISRSGHVLRSIDPTPTPEQVKARRDELEKRREADRVAFEQKRKDLALLNTYSSEREIDVTRERNIEPIRARIKSAQERIAAVDKRLEQVENEMEFYKAGKKGARKDDPSRYAPPQGLVAEGERARNEKAHLEKSIANSEKEIEALRARYEADKRRYAELKADPTLRASVERASMERPASR